MNFPFRRQKERAEKERREEEEERRKVEEEQRKKKEEEAANGGDDRIQVKLSGNIFVFKANSLFPVIINFYNFFIFLRIPPCFYFVVGFFNCLRYIESV